MRTISCRNPRCGSELPLAWQAFPIIAQVPDPAFFGSPQDSKRPPSALVRRFAVVLTHAQGSRPAETSLNPRGFRPSDSPTRALARRFDGALRSRGSLARLARIFE